jgi:hypothetical protein
MTGINGVHLLMSYIRAHAKSVGLRADGDVERILQESGTLSARVRKIEQMLSHRPVTGSAPAEPPPVIADAEWPINSALRDAINRQPRQQIVGDWNASTLDVHEAEAFHHRMEGPPETELGPLPQQILLQRYVPTGDDISEAFQSYNFNAVETAGTFARNLERGARPDREGSERGHIILIAVGFLLILSMFL